MLNLEASPGAGPSAPGSLSRSRHLQSSPLRQAGIKALLWELCTVSHWGQIHICVHLLPAFPPPFLFWLGAHLPCCASGSVQGLQRMAEPIPPFLLHSCPPAFLPANTAHFSCFIIIYGQKLADGNANKIPNGEKQTLGIVKSKELNLPSR